MFRTINRVLLIIFVVVLCGVPLTSFAQSGKRLLTINGIEFTDDDYKHWWSHWNDNNQIGAPVSADDFINFQLMVQQGQEMGYDGQPDYLHKLDVFLQVRALMALKYDEIDSKVVITDAEVKNNFDENYGTIWALQILSFDSEAKAQRYMTQCCHSLGSQLVNWLSRIGLEGIRGEG